MLPPREVGGHRLVIDLIDKGLTRFKLAQKSLLANGLAVIQSTQAQPVDIAARPSALPQPVSQHAKVASPVPRPPVPDTGNGLLLLMQDMGAKIRVQLA